MRILFSPQRREDALTIKRFGDKLVLNDDLSLDFSNLGEGAVGTFDESPSEFLAGPVRRVNGVIELTLIRPHGPNPSEAEAFPQPITLADGQTITINAEPVDEND